MDDLKDTSGWLDAVKAALYERISSPFLGSLAIAWIAWNYKFLLIIFSDYDVDYKFNYVEIFLYPTGVAFREYWIWYPLLSVAIFYIAYPIPSLIAYTISSYTKLWLKRINIMVRGITPINQEKAQALYAQISELELSKDKLFKENENTINSLKVYIDELESKISNNSDSPKDFEQQELSEIHDEEMHEENNNRLVNDDDYLNNLAKSLKLDFHDLGVDSITGYITELVMISLNGARPVNAKALRDFMIKISGFSSIRVDNIINKMISSHYLSFQENNGSRYYVLGDEGKSHLLNKLIDNKSVEEYVSDSRIGG